MPKLQFFLKQKQILCVGIQTNKGDSKYAEP